MNRDELLAALIAERQDHRWFRPPPREPKKPSQVHVPRDDEVTTARRRKALVDDAELARGRWVTRGVVKHWEASA